MKLSMQMSQAKKRMLIKDKTITNLREILKVILMKM